MKMRAKHRRREWVREKQTLKNDGDSCRKRQEFKMMEAIAD